MRERHTASALTSARARWAFPWPQASVTFALSFVRGRPYPPYFLTELAICRRFIFSVDSFSLALAIDQVIQTTFICSLCVSFLKCEAMLLTLKLDCLRETAAEVGEVCFTASERCTSPVSSLGCQRAKPSTWCAQCPAQLFPSGLHVSAVRETSYE